MRRSLNILFIGLVIISFFGCKKVEGPGGESTIEGKVMLKVYDVDYKVLQRIVPAAEENVYITYGDNDYIADKTTTGSDGSYRFDYLQTGTYRIIVFTEDSVSIMEKKASAIKVVTIGDSKTVNVDTIFKLKTENYNAGFSSISGKLMLKVYDIDFKVLQRIVPAADENVYITYGNNSYIGDKVVSGADGSFQFDNLLEGTYNIVIYTEDSTGEMEKKASVIKTVTITSIANINIDTVYKMKTVNFDGGFASISGRIMQVNWTKYYTDIVDTTFSQERDVYLIYGDHKVFDQRYRTNYDGKFEFDNLIKGDYTMFVYSEDIYGSPEMHAQIFKFKVNDQNQVVDTANNIINYIPDIFINVQI